MTDKNTRASLEALTESDLELWQACLAEYNRYMQLAQATLAGLQAVFVKRYALGEQDRITPEGEILREKKAEGKEQ